MRWVECFCVISFSCVCVGGGGEHALAMQCECVPGHPLTACVSIWAILNGDAVGGAETEGEAIDGERDGGDPSTRGPPLIHET